MRVYHGTNVEFDVPNLDLCRAHKDFGKGFYVTNKKTSARDWSKKKNRLNDDVIINIYTIADNLLETGNPEGLRVKIFREASPEWAKFLYNNRENKNFRHPYDIVIGPMGDNGIGIYFAQVKRKEKTLEQIVHEINYTKFKAIQYSFNTQRAINYLRYENSDRTSGRHRG